jgi:hypothetical protein
MAEQNDVEQVMLALGRDAKAAAPALATSNDDTRNKALRGAAAALRARTAAILEANETDVVAAKARGLSAAMVDRLQLDAKRVEGIAAGLEAIANLADPIGKVDKEWMMPGVRGRNRSIKKKKDEAGKTRLNTSSHFDRVDVIDSTAAPRKTHNEPPNALLYSSMDCVQYHAIRMKPARSTTRGCTLSGCACRWA